MALLTDWFKIPRAELEETVLISPSTTFSRNRGVYLDTNTVLHSSTLVPALSWLSRATPGLGGIPCPGSAGLPMATLWVAQCWLCLALPQSLVVGTAQSDRHGRDSTCTYCMCLLVMERMEALELSWECHTVCSTSYHTSIGSWSCPAFGKNSLALLKDEVRMQDVPWLCAHCSCPVSVLGAGAEHRRWEPGCCSLPAMWNVSWFAGLWARNISACDFLVFINLRFSDAVGLLSSWFTFWVWKVWTCTSIHRFVPLCTALHQAASQPFLLRGMIEDFYAGVNARMQNPPEAVCSSPAYCCLLCHHIFYIPFSGSLQYHPKLTGIVFPSLLTTIRVVLLSVCWKRLSSFLNTIMY